MARFGQVKAEIIRDLINDEEKCLAFIASEKWRDGFVCRKCGNTNYCSGKKPHSRRCTRCKNEESATAHTIFHGCRIPITSAMELAYLVCKRPDISTYELARQLETRQMTCWRFKKTILQCVSEKGELSLMGDS